MCTSHGKAPAAGDHQDAGAGQPAGSGPGCLRAGSASTGHLPDAAVPRIGNQQVGRMAGRPASAEVHLGRGGGDAVPGEPWGYRCRPRCRCPPRSSPARRTRRCINSRSLAPAWGGQGVSGMAKIVEVHCRDTPLSRLPEKPDHGRKFLRRNGKAPNAFRLDAQLCDGYMDLTGSR